MMPRNFRPVNGPLASARISPLAPPFQKTRVRTAAMRRGLKYEEKVQEFMLDQFRDFYLPSPWLHFREEDSEQFRWCQPDGVLLDVARGVIHIIEIKYSHTSDAWWQVRKLYLPVLSRIFPPSLWRFEVGEIVKWYDPDICFPESVQLVDNPMKNSNAFKVHIFNP